MKKVLFVASVQGHIRGFHLPFIRYFINNGYEVHVATNLDGTNDTNDKLIWKDMQFTRKPITIGNFRAFIELLSYMKENKFDLVHTHTPTASMICRICSRFTKTKPVIYTAHGFHFYKGAPFKNWLVYYSIEKMMSRWTDIILTMNEEDYTIAQNKFKKTRVLKVKGVGIDINEYDIGETKDLNFKSSLGLEKDDFVISYAANLIKRKNHKQLLIAVEKLVKKYPCIKLLIVGSGDLYNDIKDYLVKKDLLKNIIMTGERKDIGSILNITDLYVSTSYQEGLPRNVMEAMAAKLPIVTTNIRGSRDLVLDGINGFTIRIDDIEDTINAIEKLYLDKSMREKMGNASQMLIKEYDINSVLKDMSKIYESALGLNI